MAVALGLTAGCTTGIQLTDKGEQTRELSMADMPAGCRLIGDVTIGLPPDAGRPPTRDDLNKLMRNRAGQNGGNVVVVDFAEERNPNDEDARHWVGRGRAYACPEPEEESAGGAAPIEDDGATGDDTGEGAGELDDEDLGLDEEGAEGDDGGDGVSDEDLLGD
ncbi:MAG: DUF4156 domain-containing protein [Actinobacteria bacterium]|nr:DUF4156 domain-containing protein [Actinomycetota bacterium]NIU68945.1 DUF4156 domain-containing protein [Actinomycetota bacterium]NIW30794.1 hypothetical protein [Actinomycetota bacterium]